MSRIGNAPIELKDGVSMSIDKSNIVTIKGPKGELKEKIHPDIEIKEENGSIVIQRPTEQKRHKSMHGLYRSVVQNMVEGVTNGYVRELELVGVGYRVTNTGNLIELSLGYSHPIFFMVPDELKVTTEMQKGKNPKVVLEGLDKQLIGQVAAKIRSFRKPEPYKGKGIKFANEEIRRKAGKTAGA